MCKSALLTILPDNRNIYNYIAYTYTLPGNNIVVFCPFCIDFSYPDEQLTLEKMKANTRHCKSCNDCIQTQYKLLKQIVESYSVEEWKRIVNVNSIEAVKMLLGVY
mgnify:CR=1 FL=1|tara:strand:- start:144 stop:461 length:318 start_codon:yes stop_codon:yes gene_type:complete